MSGAKHTPGPWFADEAGIVRRGSADTQRYAEAVPIATPWIEGAWRYEDCTEESKANARLIAAAPEMLHELWAAVSQIEALGGDASTQRATIAKATGGEA